MVILSLRKRHEHSSQASSKTLLAVIDSVVEIIKSSDMPFSMIAVFGAVMSQLENDATLENEEVRLQLESCILRERHVASKINLLCCIRPGPFNCR